MNTTTISIITNQGDREIEAEIHGNYAVHKATRGWGWSVTHVETGLSVGDVLTKEAAIWVATNLPLPESLEDLRRFKAQAYELIRKADFLTVGDRQSLSVQLVELLTPELLGSLAHLLDLLRDVRRQAAGEASLVNDPDYDEF